MRPWEKSEAWLPRREVAEWAGVHLNTVRLWENSNRVRWKRGNSGHIFINREDAEAIIRKREDRKREANPRESLRLARLEERVAFLESRLARLEEENRGHA